MPHAGGGAWAGLVVAAGGAGSLILNFLTGVNLNYREITALRHIPFLGEPVSVAVGVPNPWMLVGQVSLVLLVIFVTDAALTVWRRGDRRQALVVGGSLGFCVLMGTAQAILVLWGILPMPITASLFYMGVVAAMGFELSREVLRAAELLGDLRESEQRINALKSKIAKEIASTLKDKLDNSFGLAEDWWDPYVGLRGRYNISKAFYLTAKGDIGGFGVGSDLTWQLSGALGCQVTRSIFVEAGYRYLYTDYNKSGFVYDVTQSGVEITTGITF